jgi:predicted cupin superfamily sugar epimerase
VTGDLRDLLGLRPHPEGGWYARTWASGHSVQPAGYPGPRPAGTAIYFLLRPGEQSRWHTVRSDELWLWHRGGSLELSLAGSGDRPATDPTVLRLGPDPAAGEHPQAVVPGGVWQSARPATGDEVLVSCVVVPGFDFADFQLGPS